MALAGFSRLSYPGAVRGTHTLERKVVKRADLRYEGWFSSSHELILWERGQGADEVAAVNRKALARTVRELEAGTHKGAKVFMNRGLHWTTKGGKTSWVYLSKIKTIESRTFCMYAPLLAGTQGQSPYVHSKIALIDDKVAFVGSSNWTYRSMQYDGEISALIENKLEVVDIRTELLKHWGVPNGDPAKWKSHVAKNARELATGKAKRCQVYMVPLTLADFGTTWKDLAAWGSWAAADYI